jgi:hypothetical protein
MIIQFVPNLILSLIFFIGSIKELVKVEKNGLLFSSSSELADEFLVPC